MNSKPSSYSGNGPYAFVSYSHQDSHIVYPVIEQLVRQGYNVWYDNGIPLVSDYGGVLYDRIKNCSVFVLFVSLNSVQSEDVAKEAAHAISFKKPIVQVIIDENAELPPSIAFHRPLRGRIEGHGRLQPRLPADPHQVRAGPGQA